MKKITIYLSLLLTIGFCAKAQTAAESNVEIMKVSQPCISATYNFSQDLLDETIKAKFSDAKVGSPDKSKGFKIYKGVLFPDFGTDKMDIYIKTDGKKETSICNIAVSKGYDNFMTSKTDPEVIANVTKWMNNLTGGINTTKIAHDIEDAQDVLKKAEKKYNGSVSDGTDYQKDLEKLQKKIEENKADQAKLNTEFEKAKTKLAELKAMLPATK